MFTIPQADYDKLKEEKFAPDSEHAEEEGMELQPEVKEEEKEEKVSVSPEEDTVADKARIPYSRFEKVNEQRLVAETKLAMLQEQLAQGKPTESNQDLTPSQWLKLYGDNDDARAAWVLDQELKQEMRDSLKSEILNDIEERETTREKVLESNIEYIEDNLLKFQEELGRELTDAEESAILDIQDELTPKDSKGNYIKDVPLFPADKAFEIYSLRQGVQRAEKSVARRRVTSITGSSDSGDTSSSDSFRPGVRGQWRDKL